MGGGILMADLLGGVSRRTFLAGTAFAAASTVVRGQSSSRDAKPLGYALVGIGSLSMGQLLPAFAECKYARPVALVSGHPEKAKQQATKYGIDPKNIYNYENFDSIKDNPEIDVVYVVLPNGMHAEYTIRAAKAGKHVLCEKPMANTPEECQAMINACRAASRKLMIAYRLHYEPVTQKAIELARSPDAVGAIKQITAEAGFNIGDPTQWRLNRKLAGGGSLMDIGIYALQAVRYLSGEEPVSVSAMSYSTPDDPRFKEVEETIQFDLQLPSGALASCTSSYGFSCSRFRVFGTAGQLDSEPFLWYGGTRLWHGRGGGEREELVIEPGNHFALEMDHFSQCVQNDETPKTPGEEGLRDLTIMMGIYEAARSGKTVTLT
jgi:predicted dehydrogenase